MQYLKPQSITTLYQAHHGWLFNYFKRKLNCPDDAADLAQDAFLRLFEKPRKFDDLAGARHYLSAVARRMCIDSWRRKQVEQAYLETLAELPERHEISTESYHLTIDLLCKIDKLLAELPDKVAKTFVASQLEGYTYKEIALQLNISVASVKNYMAKAILTLTLFAEQHQLA